MSGLPYALHKVGLQVWFLFDHMLQGCIVNITKFGTWKNEHLIGEQIHPTEPWLGFTHFLVCKPKLPLVFALGYVNTAHVM